jgi:C4-dicarboxylate transporter, DctM subunit
VTNLGFDAIWFGVIVVLIAQIGAVTPPVGMCVYVVHGVNPDVSLQTIFRGIIPFFIAMVACVGLLIVFPGMALFLPGLMR